MAKIIDFSTAVAVAKANETRFAVGDAVKVLGFMPHRSLDERPTVRDITTNEYGLQTYWMSNGGCFSGKELALHQ